MSLFSFVIHAVGASIPLYKSGANKFCVAVVSIGLSCAFSVLLFKVAIEHACVSDAFASFFEPLALLSAAPTVLAALLIVSTGLLIAFRIAFFNGLLEELELLDVLVDELFVVGVEIVTCVLPLLSVCGVVDTTLPVLESTYPPAPGTHFIAIF